METDLLCFDIRGRYEFHVLLQDALADDEVALRVATVLFDKVMIKLCHGIPASQMRSLSITDRTTFVNSLVDETAVYDMVATAKSTGHLRVHIMSAEDIDPATVNPVSLQ